MLPAMRAPQFLFAPLLGLIAAVACGETKPAASPEGAAASPSAEAAPAPEASAAPSSAEEPLSEDEMLAAIAAEESGSPAPSGSASAPASDGSAEARSEEIRKLVAARKPQIKECVESARKRDPSIDGMLTMRFVLAPDGSMQEPPTLVEEKSQITDAEVVDCAKKALSTIAYPPHPKGMQTKFTYPFGF